jgi:hypothetical protein
VRLAGYRPASAETLQADGWRTDFHRLDGPLDRIARADGVRRDAFVTPAEPAFASAADTAMDPAEPVLVVRTDDGVSAWPLALLLRPELVVSHVGERPVAVTFCSLCGTARVWDRRLDDEVLDLAVSGLLLDGNSLLWDRGTESLWRQDDGRCVAGSHAGRSLTELPSMTLSFGELRRARPDAAVMRDTPDDATPGGRRPGDNASPPAPFDVLAADDIARGEPPAWMTVACANPLEPMLALPGGDVAVAGPAVEHRGDVVVFRDASCASPYRDAAGSAGPVTGSATVFRRDVDGRALTFQVDADGSLRDAETGSRWNPLGEATAGPLAGRRLTPAPARSGFRFAVRTGSP